MICGVNIHLFVNWSMNCASRETRQVRFSVFSRVRVLTPSSLALTSVADYSLSADCYTPACESGGCGKQYLQ